ncbi:MAG: histidine kinase [Steroidobacteraceae bacterium]
MNGRHNTQQLSQPLPPELAQGEFGTGWYYERYSAFSWSWVWRRTLLFGAFAVPFGAMLGVIHGLYAHNAADGVAVGWRAALAALLVVGLGPLLAALVRHAGWPLRIERIAVVAAIVTGVLLSWSMRVSVQTYHDHLMGAHLTTAQRWMLVFSGQWPLHAVVENLTDLVAALSVHAICGGALALRSYFGEPRRRQDHAARLELECLRRQKLAADARLSVLQAQIEPHFLFNTLASVSADIEADPPRAKQLVHALAQYLRSTLPQLRHEGLVLSTLAAQFDLCRGYLEIMALRLGERLSLHVELTDEIGTTPFPPLLLLCLVENAVTHGVEPKAGPARIALTARVTGSAPGATLEVIVYDDGVGLREGLTEGTGISNVRQQLATLYGPSAQLCVETPAEGGVRASISIPLRLLQT